MKKKVVELIFYPQKRQIMINKHYVKWKMSDIKTIHYTFPFIGNVSTHRKYLEKENLKKGSALGLAIALQSSTISVESKA